MFRFFSSPFWIQAACLCLIATAQAATVGNEAHNFGSACTPDKTNGADWDTLFQCKNGIWQRAPYFFGASTDTCDTAHAGIVQWTGSALKYCDGTNWSNIGSTAGATMPDAFSLKFTAYDGSYNYTNIPTVTGGFSGTVPIQIFPQTGQVNVNSGGWVAASSSLSSGQTLQIRIPVATYINYPVVLAGSFGTPITTSDYSFIQVTSASYGASACGNNANGNVTGSSQSYCNGKSSCTISGPNNLYGDTCLNYVKSFVIYWYCTPNFTGVTKSASGGQYDTITLSCP